MFGQQTPTRGDDVSASCLGQILTQQTDDYNGRDAHANSSAGLAVTTPLPRPPRRRRRAKDNKGLPPDEEIQRLAREYLACQRKYWPRLAEAGLLPEASDAVVHQMVEQFKDRHRGGRVDPAPIHTLTRIVPVVAGV